MKNILLALFVVVAAAGRVHADDVGDFVTVESDSALAWWVHAQFHPSETQVRGIPVQKIRENWCKAAELRRELFPPKLQEDLNSVDFAVDGFFTGSETKQTALVGAYETCDGEKGGFFLILDVPRRGAPTVRFIQADRTVYPFSHIDVRDSSIWVWYCMDCDYGTQYKWDQSSQNFVEVPEEY